MSINFPDNFPSIEVMYDMLHKTIDKSWKINLSLKEIKKWLSNFNGKVYHRADEQRLALWLLCNYTFYSFEEVNHLCNILYNRLIHDMLSNKIIDKNNFIEDMKKVYFSSIGSASESGGLLLYHFRQESTLSIDRFIYPSVIEPNEDNVLVFIDDATLSGGTLRRHFYNYLEKQKYKKVYYITIIASKDAINSLGDMGIDIIYCTMVDERNQCFSDRSMVFNKFPELMEITKNMVEEYGKNIIQRPVKSLGYKNGSYMFGFYYNTPNNTLPIFWSKENWIPIFERKEKLQNAKQIELSNRFI